MKFAKGKGVGATTDLIAALCGQVAYDHSTGEDLGANLKKKNG